MQKKQLNSSLVVQQGKEDCGSSVNKYKIVSSIIIALLEKQEIACSDSQLEMLINTLYDFVCEENANIEEYNAFAKGMIKYAIVNDGLGVKAKSTYSSNKVANLKD